MRKPSIPVYVTRHCVSNVYCSIYIITVIPNRQGKANHLGEKTTTRALSRRIAINDLQRERTFTSDQRRARFFFLMSFNKV